MTDTILTTARLALAELTSADAPFIREIVNEPDFIANVRDTGVRSEADAVRYIEEGPRASYRRHGFGLLRVGERATGAPVGMCGLLRRDWLDDPDLGYAILERFRGRGYAAEAARAVLDWGRRARGLKRVLAVTTPANAASGAVLERAGFRFEGMIDTPEGRASKLFVWVAGEAP